MATIRLFKTALRDPSNKFFALISGTCIPVHDFEYTYKRMMRHPQSKITYVRNHRDEDGTVWGSQESTYAYSQEQWMILNRDTAKQLCRLADKKDTQAQAFLKSWAGKIKTEDIQDGDLAWDEIIPIHWFMKVYGPPSSDKFRRQIRKESVTFTEFVNDRDLHPKIWTTLNAEQRAIMCDCCYFARKFTDLGEQALKCKR